MDGHQFYYVVNESYIRDNVKLRVYSARTKTSFFDVFFTWKDNYTVNFYKPSIGAALIKYALGIGWNHLMDKETLVISKGSFLIKELGLDQM